MSFFTIKSYFVNLFEQINVLACAMNQCALKRPLSAEEEIKEGHTQLVSDSVYVATLV